MTFGLACLILDEDAIRYSTIRLALGSGIEAFMRKARNNLAAARHCYDAGLYDAAANRAYYAAFQGAVAVLAHYGVRKDRLDHEWVQAEFSGRLIQRRKIFTGKIRSYLSDMQAVRDIADYSRENVSKKSARNQIRKAEEIIQEIAGVMEK